MSAIWRLEKWLERCHVMQVNGPQAIKCMGRAAAPIKSHCHKLRMHGNTLLREVISIIMLPAYILWIGTLYLTLWNKEWFVMLASRKPIVHYCNPGTIRIGKPAVVTAVDHPLTRRAGPVITSPVIDINVLGFETEHSIYVHGPANEYEYSEG